MTPRSSFLPWLAPILLGALLRLLFLTHQSLWVDEILTLKAASLGEPFRWGDVLINPQGPLPHLWLRLWTAVGGAGDVSLRLWSVFGGVLGLAAAAGALRRWAGAMGLWGLWILALSPFHFWYALEVRNYIYLMAFAWLALWALDGVRRNPSPGSGLKLGGALAGALLCNLSAAFLIPALVLAAWPRSRETRWAVVVAGAVAVLAASPWVYVEIGHQVDFSRVAGGTPDIRGGRTFSPAMLPYSAAVFLGGFGSAPPLRELHTGLPLKEWLAYVPGLVALVCAAVWLYGRSLRHRPSWETRALWLWLLIPVALSVVVGILGFKAYNPRYVSVIQPAWVLLLVWGLEEGFRTRRGVTWAAAGLLLAAMVTGGVRQVADDRYHKEDFRAAARYVETQEVENDVVLLEGVSGPFERYFRGSAPVSVLYRRYVTGPEAEERFNRIAAGADRIIWVGSRLWYVDPDGAVLDRLETYGRQVAAHREAGVDIRVFARGGP